MTGELLLSHDLEGHRVTQRQADGYLDGTAVCRAAGKKLSDWLRLDTTAEFLQAVAESTGIPVDSIIERRSGRTGGTWLHGDAAIGLAQWCSPRFAAQVSKWVRELMSTGKVQIVPLHPEVDLVTDLARRFERLEATVDRLAAVPDMPAPGTRPAFPRFTTNARCHHLNWLTPSRKQRATIRRLANTLLYSRHGDTPDIIGGYSFYWGHQLACLDEAIDRVRTDAERTERAGGPRLPGC